MKKKVLLIRNVRPDMYGGGETYQLTLAEELEQHGFTPVIVSSSIGLLEEARRRKIKAVKAPFHKRQNWSGAKNLLLPQYIIWQKKLKKWYEKIFAEYKPAVINVQSRDDWIAATMAAKKMGVRVLWTDHMDFRSWVLTNVDIKYKNFIGKWILKCAHDVYRIIMISDSEKKYFQRIAMAKDLNNIVVIRNGVRDKYKEYMTSPQSGSFCYVGRIVDYKGVGELIAAFSEVEKTYSEATLSIYGTGEAEFVDKYMKMAECCDGIRFYGHTNGPLKAIAENEIFVLPSYIEGLSLSLLDAIMMGKKIIASDVGGNPEVVIDGETGLLVPSRDVKKLKEAMLWMLENKKEANTMARNARNRYIKDFNFDDIFEKQMLPLYNIEKEEE